MPEPNTKTPLLAGKKPPVSRPKAHRRRSSFEASTYNSAGRSLSYSKKAQEEDTGTPGLSLWKILTLTVCMAGVQFTCKSFVYLFWDVVILTSCLSHLLDFFLTQKRDRRVIVSMATADAKQCVIKPIIGTERLISCRWTYQRS